MGDDYGNMGDYENYDNLLSYDGGNDFFETVLGNLAKLSHDESDDETSSNSSTGSYSSTNSASSDSEISPMMKTLYEEDTEDDTYGGDKQSNVFEDSPYVVTDDIEPEMIQEDIELVNGGDADISEILIENIPDLTFQSQQFIVDGGFENEQSPLFDTNESVVEHKIENNAKTGKDIKKLIKNMINSI
jgi:hypothetical protein